MEILAFMTHPIIYQYVTLLHLTYYGIFTRTGMLDSLYDGPTAFIVTAIITSKTHDKNDGGIKNLITLIYACILATAFCKVQVVSKVKHKLAKYRKIPIGSTYNYYCCIPSTICILKEIYDVTLISHNHTLCQLVFIQRRWMQAIARYYCYTVK